MNYDKLLSDIVSQIPPEHYIEHFDADDILKALLQADGLDETLDTLTRYCYISWNDIMDCIPEEKFIQYYEMNYKQSYPEQE